MAKLNQKSETTLFEINSLNLFGGVDELGRIFLFRKGKDIEDGSVTIDVLPAEAYTHFLAGKKLKDVYKEAESKIRNYGKELTN